MESKDRCAHCGKRIYRSWRHAAYDAKHMRNDRDTRCRPYWSPECQCFHVGHHRRPWRRKS